MWPKLYDPKDNDRHQHRKRTLIFVSSYYEFLRLKQYFAKTEVDSYVSLVSEYSAKKKVQQALTRFNRGDTPFLLLTERAYYFNMYTPSLYH